ncbi:MAG: sugar transferase [Candidatus Eisenbacteria bacterium]
MRHAPSAPLHEQERSIAFNFRPWSELPEPPDVIAPVLPPPCPMIGTAHRFLALVLLLLASPVMVATAIAIKASSPGGPILYRQERVGLNRRRRAMQGPTHRGATDRRKVPNYGRMFQIYKFRTMVPDAERMTGPVWASQKDPRITPVGRILRHLRIDELPQLINVVQGTMSLIGPRPERPHFVSQLSEKIPDYVTRLAVPPGITGLAQVERDYDGSFEDVKRKVKYDIYYVKNRCYLLDVKIMLRTVDVMLRGKGAR